ncbi:MAG: regulatory protein RecX [Mogibacterium sp.]|nr:regulatory protein RecX [Mogibacterium sp.]
MTAKRTAQEEAARYLASRMRTTREVRDRLRDRGYEPEEIREVLKEFTDLGYLDDAGYARRYCEYAYEKLRGRRRILLELGERGIDAETAANACEDVRYEFGIDERANALTAALRVTADLPGPPEQKHLARVARRLESLGYDNGTILSVLTQVRDKGDSDEDLCDCGSAPVQP